MQQQVHRAHLLRGAVVPRDFERLFGLVLLQRDLERLVEELIGRLLHRCEHLLERADAAELDRLRLGQVGEGIVHREPQVVGPQRQRLPDAAGDLVVRPALIHRNLDRALLLAHALSSLLLRRQLAHVHNHAVLDVLKKLADGQQRVALALEDDIARRRLRSSGGDHRTVAATLGHVHVGGHGCRHGRRRHHGTCQLIHKDVAALQLAILEALAMDDGLEAH